MTQLVGNECVICNQRINSVLYSEFCKSCGNAVHTRCRENYQTAGDHTERSRCRQCGGKRNSAVAKAIRSGSIGPALWFGGAAVVALLTISACAVWPGANSTGDVPTAEQTSQQRDVNKEKPADLIVEIETTMGTIRAELFPDKAPKTVQNFVDLVKQGFYDDIVFHRVIDQFMIQTGDPLGNGTGGRTDKGLPRNFLPDEFHPDLRHDTEGVLSMANSGPDTGDTQFFITTVATPWLDDRHAVFGRVIEGMDVVHKIEGVDTNQQDRPRDEVKMLTVRIVEERTNGVVE